MSDSVDSLSFYDLVKALRSRVGVVINDIRSFSSVSDSGFDRSIAEKFILCLNRMTFDMDCYLALPEIFTKVECEKLRDRLVDYKGFFADFVEGYFGLSSQDARHSFMMSYLTKYSSPDYYKTWLEESFCGREKRMSVGQMIVDEWIKEVNKETSDEKKKE